MSGRRVGFRGSLTLRPAVPAAGGLALLIIALAAQSHTSYVRWLELDKRGEWRAEMGVDFSREGSWQTTFRPVVSRTHTVRFTLRAPLLDDMAEHSANGHALSESLTQRSLVGKEFALSWRIAGQGQRVAEGSIHASDLKAWAEGDHARYQYAFGLPQLEAGQEYTLTAQVKQANPAVNGLSPILEVHTWGTLKGRALAGVWRPWHTLLFCGVGASLLLLAYVQRRHHRESIHSESPESR